MFTITCDVTVLVFGECKKRGPSREVVHVEVDIVILRQRVKVCQVHPEQVLWLKSAKGSHDYLSMHMIYDSEIRKHATMLQNLISHLCSPAPGGSRK